MDSPVRRKLISFFLAATVAVTLLAASPARATFPGANGRIAFERGNATAEFDIYAVNPDGSGELNLTHNGSNNREIAWSPDGSEVAFRSDGDGGDYHYDVYLARPDGSGAAKLTDTGNADGPDWSPDGRSIAFGDQYIYTVRADGTGLHAVTGSEFAWGAWNPTWSPDGERLLFEVDDGIHADIYVVNRDGSGLKRLTNDNELRELPRNPSWSPDGTRIAYGARELGCGGFCYPIHVMNADGTDKRSVTDVPSSFQTWAPDGSKIAFTGSPDGINAVLYTVNPDGTGETRVSDAAAYEPQWSADGRQLVFWRSSTTSEGSIYAINRDGTGERYVSEGSSPQWQSLPLGGTAKQFCKAERRRLGKKMFRAHYGRTKNGSDALSNCVDLHRSG